jgi:hypothetical protein
MITITPEAATQIRQSAEVSNSQGMHLRIAVRREDNGTFVYGMGFDEMAMTTHCSLPKALMLSSRTPARIFLLVPRRFRRDRSWRAPIHFHQSQRSGACLVVEDAAPK